MNISIKKTISLILIGLVLILTIVGLLGIWDIINLKEVMNKIFKSLFMIFVSSAIILFIYSVLMKGK